VGGGGGGGRGARHPDAAAGRGLGGLGDDWGVLPRAAGRVGRIPTGGGRVMDQGVIPMLAYENGPAAMDWLAEAFGFVEKDRRVEDGRLTHGEMDTGGGVVMMATP